MKCFKPQPNLSVSKIFENTLNKLLAPYAIRSEVNYNDLNSSVRIYNFKSHLLFDFSVDLNAFKPEKIFDRIFEFSN